MRSRLPGEVERIRRACAVTQRIFEDVTGLVRPGMTEMEVHEFINERMQTYGVHSLLGSRILPGSDDVAPSRRTHAPNGRRISARAMACRSTSASSMRDMAQTSSASGLSRSRVDPASIPNSNTLLKRCATRSDSRASS